MKAQKTKSPFSFKLNFSKTNQWKDGSFPLCLVVRKDDQRKIISLRASAFKEQWNDETQRFDVDKRKTNLHPDRVLLNVWLNEVEGRCYEILKDFEKNRTDWTLNQFEQAFLNKSKKTGIESYFLQHIDKLNRAGKIGNKICYENTLDMLKIYDPKFGKMVFNELDLKYIKGFHEYLQIERGCVGNTIKYYIKTLRALLNKAISDGEASSVTYPFGKNGYSVAELVQETDKRYLPSEYIERLKTANIDTYHLNWCRNLFLFSYYCQGMSFVDVANLTNKNILVYEDGKYITYRRQKTEGKNSKFIRIKITEQIQIILDWFKIESKLIGDHLTPVVSIDGYEGEALYNHIRNRYKRFNNYLKPLAESLNFEGVQLSSYMSRHSYAMRLKNSGIPEDVISEALGHKDLSTTKVYLDSFGNNEIANANKCL